MDDVLGRETYTQVLDLAATQPVSGILIGLVVAAAGYCALRVLSPGRVPGDSVTLLLMFGTAIGGSGWLMWQGWPFDAAVIVGGTLAAVVVLTHAVVSVVRWITGG